MIGTDVDATCKLAAAVDGGDESSPGIHSRTRARPDHPPGTGLPALPGPYRMAYGGPRVIDMWHWNGMGAWGWMMMAAFWLIVIALVIWTVRSTTGPPPRDENQALRILDERFARGEIDQNEYEERRRVLEGGR